MLKAQNQGFTLIEVLVASLIIMLGVVGYATIQGEYFRSDSNTKMRSIALDLAQQKLDDLRKFTALDSAAGVFAYADIDNNAGGNIPSGVVNMQFNADNQRAYQFVRSWEVTSQYYVDTDADGIEDAWLDAGDASLPTTLPAHPSQKHIDVSVSWVDRDGQAKSVNLSAKVAPVLMAGSLQAVNEGANAQIDPQVSYTPGSAPDVISYDLGNGESVETSKPVPDIDNQNENNIVKFETIKYLQNSNNTDKLQQEDFLTVNCSCKLAGSGTGYTPSMTTLNNGSLGVTPGMAVTKMTGVPANNQQPELCTQCCRDHHDTATMISTETYYRSENGSPHAHYDRQNNGTYLLATSSGDSYDEACRFKRVDGLFELYPDWQLIDVVEFGSDYLSTQTILDNYRDYAEGVIKANVQSTSPPTKPSDRDLTVAPGAYQLIARGIYLDRMTSSHQTAVQALISANDESWKAITPFYDVNLTLLSEWSSSDENVATVTQEPISTIVDPTNNYYGTYSRGRVEALADGTMTPQVTAYAYNSGITGTPPISPFDLASAIADASMTITVDSKSSAEKFYALIGNISCIMMVNGAPQSCETNNTKKSTYVDLSNMTLTDSPSQFSCDVTVPRGKSTPFYSCNNVSENWKGTIQVAFSKPGFNTVIKIQYPNGTLYTTDTISIPNGISQTSQQEYNIVLELVPN